MRAVSFRTPRHEAELRLVSSGLYGLDALLVAQPTVSVNGTLAETQTIDVVVHGQSQI